MLATYRSRPENISRYGLGVFLCLLVYDGALRKWLLPEWEQLIFLAKDLVLLTTFVFVYTNGARLPKTVAPKVIKELVLVYALWVVIECFNNNLPNLFVGAWGLKAHALYMSLLLLVPIAFKDNRDALECLARLYPKVVIPVCSLCFIQLSSPADSFINQQVRGGLEMISYFGNESLVRVTGTFSYISGMTAFVQGAFTLGLALFILGLRTRWFLVGFIFVMAALPATGARSVIVFALTAGIMMISCAMIVRLTTVARGVSLVALIASLVVATVVVQGDAWEAIQQRAASVAEEEGDSQRVFTAFTNAFDMFDTAGLFGFGTGATNLGSVALASNVLPFSWLPVGDRFEEESGRLVLELGVIGWILSLSLRLAIFVWAARTAIAGRRRDIRAVGIMALPVAALGLLQGSGVFAPPIGTTFYWLCVGLLAVCHREQTEVSASYIAHNGTLRWQK